MIGSWNVRGLNGFSTQRSVRQWISQFSLGIIGLLETKVDQHHIGSVVSAVCPSWQFLSNVTNSIACRVLVCWDPRLYSMSCVHFSPQWVSCRATRLSDAVSFGLIFVHGSNDPGTRRQLWDFIRNQPADFGDLPWLALGDFNAILRSSDRIGGDQAWHSYMDEFGQCIHDAELIRVPFSRL